MPTADAGAIIGYLLLATIVGLVVSAVKIKYSVKYTYRCKKCGISFFWAHSLYEHQKLIHGPEPIKQTRVLVLGGGFAGIEVLRKLQRAFQDDVEIEITIVSKNNFFLFTPMLHEVSSGMIDTRHIATPVRKFCTRAKFYEASVESIDLKNKRVAIVHDVGSEWQASTQRHALSYDYLVIALGSETKFASLPGVAKNTITLKDLDDAITLRNHVISMLEQAELEHQNPELKNRLMTFVVAGGGFSGVEIVGELNDFVRSSIKDLYHNIEGSDVRVMLVASGDRLLPELSKELGEFAQQQLQKSGVQVMLNRRVKEATGDRVILEGGEAIQSHTLIWAAGVGPEKLVAELACEHDKRGRIVVNDSLEVRGLEHVYAVGDCAAILDAAGNLVCPATAQHAIREGKVAAYNIIAAIRGHAEDYKFDYKTRGMMATVGRHNGIAMVGRIKLHGFVAWWLWRTFYLANLPTLEKKLRVMADWTIDLLFKRDVTRVKAYGKSREIANVRPRNI